ncbi:peptidase M6 [Streptomyces sp. NHF165]|uniref:peptidase M6 n=1 Tax=Streptomyces sp. NHF165 TaxID=2175864 RepID=UPI00132EE81D|nr:peptidase M6 [Streptomyces sp. NHF165]QHF93957.1 peptidase M6 [Streptomyces sp. NHF165]
MTPRSTPQHPTARAARHHPALAVATALATACLTLAAPAEATEARGIAGPCAIAPGDGTDEGPLTSDGTPYVHPHGHKRAVMLMVDFPDHPSTTPAPERSRFFTRYGDRFLKRSSFGAYRLDVRASSTWIRMPRPWSSYGITRGISARLMRGYVKDAVDAAARQGVRLDGADLVFVVADRNVPAAPTVSQAHTFDGLHAGGAVVHGAALVFGRDHDSALWQRGNFVHEANHLYGLPDLYNVAEGASVEYAGGWDTMSMAGISDQLGWHKWKFGWLPGSRVECVRDAGTSEHTLAPVSSPRAGLTVVRTGRHRALVAEARTRTGLDRGICSEGVLVYSVDSQVPTGQGPVRVLDAHPHSGGGPHCADRLPPELAELSDAPLTPGEERTLPGGVRVEVTGRAGDGYRISVHTPEGASAD